MSSVGVDIRTGFPARSIVVESGLVVGVVVHGGIMKANSVVIATGGASYPKTGSTGDGYALAKEVGHSIIDPEPALSALTTTQDWVKDLQGLSLRNVRVALTIDRPDAKQTQVASGFGEMLFTHFGVSGPIILTLSRSARPYLRSHNLIVSIDLKPGLTEEQLHVRLIRDFAQSRHVGNYLRTLLPRMLIDVFLNLAGIASDTPTNTITSQQRSRIVSLLKDFRLTAAGLRPLEEAIVTAGGVPTKEIDPTTMMSKLVGGLYFAGEVIDIDAETGGFNLQAAFSTGSVAGGAAAGS